MVDVSKLAHPDDIKKDMYGKWIHSGSHADVFKCTYRDDDSVYIEKAALGASGDNIFTYNVYTVSTQVIVNLGDY